MRLYNGRWCQVDLGLSANDWWVGLRRVPDQAGIETLWQVQVLPLLALTIYRAHNSWRE